MPGMSGSGNMMPQSRTRMRPSTSMQAQFRPISPSPPRKTIRTGFALRSACCLLAALAALPRWALAALAALRQAGRP